jgi:hypothetical protein
MLTLLSWIVLWWRFSSYFRGNVKLQPGWGHLRRFSLRLLLSLSSFVPPDVERLVSFSRNCAGVIEFPLPLDLVVAMLASIHLGKSVNRDVMFD